MTPGALKAAYGSSEVRDLYGGLGKLHGTHWANILSMCQRAVALFTVHARILESGRGWRHQRAVRACRAGALDSRLVFFFFKQKTAYEVGM